MAKSTIAAILEAQRAVNQLDRHGRLAILNDLMKQDLGPTLKSHGILGLRAGQSTHGGATKEPANYTEGGES